MRELIERWRHIRGFPSYMVSDHGSVRRMTRHGNHPPGLLRQSSDKDGYLLVALWNGKRQVMRRVALLVLAAFSPEQRRDRQANHKNGVKQDNRYDNLEYMTCGQNIAHAIETGLRDLRGERNPDSRLTDVQVVELRERAARGESYISLGEAFGISNVVAGSIARGKLWRHVGGPISGARKRGRPPRAI